MTDQRKKLLLFCKAGIPTEGYEEDEIISVRVYGAVIIPEDEEPCQDFIDAAAAEGIQLATYDYHPDLEADPSQFEPSLFHHGKIIADRLNNLIMARFN